MSPSGQNPRSSKAQWLLAIIIILAPIALGISVRPKPIPSPADTEVTSIPIYTSTLEDIGMKETIVYQCNTNHEINYSVIRLSPFGGISPYTIQITPLENGLPRPDKSFIADPEKPFSYDAGKAFSYTVSSNTPDKKPNISGTISIPLTSDDLCGTQQSITKIFTNEPSSTRTPKKESPDTQGPVNTPLTGTDTPVEIKSVTQPEISASSTATSPIVIIGTTPSILNPAACNDGKDNDSDGLVDFPIDPQCSDKQDNHEDS